VLIGLCLALVLIAGVGIMKYRAIQRMRIENSVFDSLQNAPSATLRRARVSVSVSDTGEVILDGIVPSSADSSAAAVLSASVSGVTHVNNRLRVVPPVGPDASTESADSLISRGMASMDAGDYATAIDCFSKAASDPSKNGKELLDKARKAQKTEEELLKKRR